MAKKGRTSKIERWVPPLTAKERYRLSSCTHKVRHATAELAAAAITDMVANGRLGAESLQAYGPCEFCTRWHVGHLPGVKWRPARIGDDVIEAWVREHRGPEGKGGGEDVSAEG